MNRRHRGAFRAVAGTNGCTPIVGPDEAAAAQSGRSDLRVTGSETRDHSTDEASMIEAFTIEVPPGADITFRVACER